MSTVTVVATPEPNNHPPRVRLDITDTGTPAVTSTTVTRLNANGRTVPVRTADGGPLTLVTSGSNRVGLLYDYEPPDYGMPVSYSTMESPSVSSAQVSLDVNQVWLIHPGLPALSMPIELRASSLAEETFTVQQGVFWPMGRENPVIVTDGTRKGAQSSLTVGVATATDVRAIRDLVADAGVLLLNIPLSLGFLFDSSYIAVGEVRRARISDIGADPHRDVVMPFFVVDRPIGGSQSQRTLADLLSYPTLASLQVAYPTLAAVLAGP